MDKISCPVLLPSGITIDEAAMDDLIKRNEKDPFNKNLTLSTKTKNLFAAKVIDALAESELKLNDYKSGKKSGTAAKQKNK